MSTTTSAAPLDDDRTIIWNPKQQGAAKPNATTQDPDLPPLLPSALSRYPITGSALPLLNALIAFHRIPAVRDLAALRHGLVSAIQKFERTADEAGALADDIIAARYLLCCALDEAIATTSWLDDSDWSKSSLLVTFHNETWGGDKAFTLIERLRDEPRHYADLLELAYYILALGFQGKYRVQSNGLLALEDLRVDIARQLTLDPATEADMPPAVVPQALFRARTRLRYVPVWVSLAIAAVLIVGLAIWFESHVTHNLRQVVEAVQAIDAKFWKTPAEPDTTAITPRPASGDLATTRNQSP